MTRFLPTLAFAVFAVLAPGAATLAQPQTAAHAQQLPRIEGAWVRATVPGQQASGAFMRITAPHASKLVGVSTPVAGVAEVHEMKMEGEVMKMRAVPQLDLPAGRTVDLKPGGYHVMLMELKQPLTAGSKVPLTLTFQDAAGAKQSVDVSAPVAVTAPAGAGHAGMSGMDMHKH